MNPIPDLRPHPFIWFSAPAAIALGGVGFAGWVLDISLLKTVLPGFAVMKVPTALGLVLAGTTLAMLACGQVTKRACRSVVALSLAVIFLGVLSLAEHALGREFLFGSWLIDTPAGAEAAFGSGRMAPSGGFGLILVGSALLVACPGPDPVRVQVPVLLALGMTVTLGAGLVLVGYAVEGVSGFRLWNHVGVAVHAAAGFGLLGGGLLALARGRGELTWSVDALTTGGFVIGVGSLLAAAAGSQNFTRQMQQTNAWVSRTHEALQEINEVAASLANVESGRHAYLVTGDEGLLERRAALQTIVRGNLADLRALTADNPGQQRQVDRLEVLAIQRANFGDRIIGTRRQSGSLAGEPVPAIGAGLAITDHIRDLLREMEREEYSLLTARQAQANAIAARTFLFLPLGGVLSVTMLSLGLFFLNAGITERKRAEEKVRRLATFPERSPSPVIELDLASGAMHYINPAAVRRFPDLASRGLEHPWLAGLPEAAAPLLAGTVEVVNREIALGECAYIQTISCVSETRLVRIYSSDITAHKRAQDALRELSARLLLIQEEERRRIARELHDSTAQELAAISMNLGRLQEGIEGRDPAHDNLLADSLAILAASGRDLRTLSYLLHPQLLDELGLAGALRHYVAGFTERSGIGVELEEELHGARFPVAMEMVLFRVVQESLANVLRHSGSPSATVRLRRHQGWLELEVADRGCGFPPEFLAAHGGRVRLGVGIAGMRERLHQLGGRLEFSSEAGGTTVRATVPLAEGRA